MSDGRPRLEIALRSDGALVILLPGSEGRQREVLTTLGACGSTVHRILSSPETVRSLGLAGEPTVDLVNHWEKHSDWPKSNCVHCMAEGRVSGHASLRERARVLMSRSDGTVVRVQRLPEAGPGAALKAKIDVNLEDLFGDGEGGDAPCDSE